MIHQKNNITGQDLASYLSKLLHKPTTRNRLYESDAALFDLLASFRDKYGLDVEDYIMYYVKFLGRPSTDVSAQDLVDATSISRYLEWRAVLGSYEEALKYFDKSVENVANLCISTNPVTPPKDYFDSLIDQDILGDFVISGRISLYYLAGIRDFGTTLKTLKPMVSFKTIGYFVENFDIYENYIKSAFIELRGTHCDSFLITEKKIREKLLVY